MAETKTKANLKSQSKMKVNWNTCEKTCGIVCVSTMKILPEVHLKTSKGHFFLEKFMEIICKKTVYIVYNYII